ncbi:MAG TPA: Xaa-Pro peptidase family protein [Mycobacteriales bacterium]|nr:Xaa-Pro peptidase family protein [Mycobacteriales bacterium]
MADAARLNAHALGPGSDLLEEWRDAGLRTPDREAVQHYRIDRLRAQLVANRCDGALLYDPVNIRYATDTTNMSLWTMHNQVRYVFVATSGPVILFEFSGADFLDMHSQVIDEIRPGRSFIHFYSGPRTAEIADYWAAEIADLVQEHGRGDRRLAVDVVDLVGIRALESKGLVLVPAMPLMEEARSIKSAEEIQAMRCAVHAANLSVRDMHDKLVPGATEIDLWTALQSANSERFGEWLETRLLSSGPRTNPWYQEASVRRIERGDLVAFDTDLIGSFGMCVDFSRTWLCDRDTPDPFQADVYSLALEQMERNIPLHVAGATLREITERAWYPSIERYNHYTCISHGVGLCDEYPVVYSREEWNDVGYDGVLEPGMVMSIEAFVGLRHGHEGVKLEQQVLITEHGNEVLTRYPLSLTR